jgi:hypothetical protein
VSGRKKHGKKSKKNNLCSVWITCIEKYEKTRRGCWYSLRRNIYGGRKSRDIKTRSRQYESVEVIDICEVYDI